MQKARIKLSSNNITKLNSIIYSIMDVVEKTKVKVSGPIPLPTHRMTYRFHSPAGLAMFFDGTAVPMTPPQSWAVIFSLPCVSRICTSKPVLTWLIGSRTLRKTPELPPLLNLNSRSRMKSPYLRSVVR